MNAPDPSGAHDAPSPAPESSASGGSRPLSFALLAIGVVGSAVAVLALTTLAVAVVPVSPTGKAGIALVGIVLAVVAMASASRYLTARAVRAEFGPQNADD